MKNNYDFKGFSSFMKTFNEEQTCREFLVEYCENVAVKRKATLFHLN